VQSNLFGANEILARRRVVGDGGGQLIHAQVRETERVEIRSPLGDLEPVGAAAIPRCSSIGGLAEVDSGGTLMVDIGVDLEANGVAGIDSDSLASLAWGDIAAHVRRSDWLNRRVVLGLADCIRGGLVACDQGVEDVVGRGSLDNGAEGKEGGCEFHDE